MEIWTRGVGWTWEAAARAGAETRMGYKLRRTLLDAGLDEPYLELASAVGGGPEWAGYEVLAASVRSMLPLILSHGIATEAEIDIDTLPERLRDCTVAADAVVKAPDIVSARTRRPADVELAR